MRALIMPKKKYTGPIRGFTLLEVMISLAIISGLLVTLIYTLNYHLGVAERQEGETVALILAKQKLGEIRDAPDKAEGAFPEPYAAYKYWASVGESVFPGVSELSVTVTNSKEKVTLKELIRSKKAKTDNVSTER